MKTAEEILLIEVKNYNGNYNSVLEFFGGSSEFVLEAMKQYAKQALIEIEKERSNYYAEDAFEIVPLDKWIETNIDLI